MSLPPRVMVLHDRAVAQGQPGYFDPDSGLFVLTAAHLGRQSTCCGKGCRHCPWPPEAQRAAGRPGSR